ncbi:MAG: prolyl oligopeptidase family serine peptidase [Prevotellaceae bacterium]|jgi:dipeptidyl aminopeptidase/acylaminoacyl peptidase|nr:prolyl oligopeptidase family serine peptidase [Prevotellaceae bacterium]
MNKKTLIISLILILTSASLVAQKKVLDHSVYDGWKTITGESLTKNGGYTVYYINPQEGDGSLVVTNTKNNSSFSVSRGYQHTITPDQQQVVFLIKPLFADTRDAKIKKRKPEEMPKDSLAILNFGTQRVFKIPYVKSYKMGKDASNYVAYLSVAPADTTGGKKAPKRDKDEGYPLIIRNLSNGQEDTIKNVVDYAFSDNGKYIAATLQPNSKDSVAKAGVILYDITKKENELLASGKGKYKQPVFAEDGLQLAFLADCDTSKVEPKDFELYYYKQGLDSAIIIADEGMNGMPQKWSVGENRTPSFSKNGQRLFFGIVPIRPPKDTTIVDFEVAKLDIWHWNEPNLQPMQLKNLDRELKRTYLSVISLDKLSKIIPLADKNMKDVRTPDDGNAAYALGLDDSKYRIEMQWEGSARNDVYAISVADGSKILVAEALNGLTSISPGGKYIMWYDMKKRQWYSYSIDSKKTICLTDKINVNFWDEEHDTPSDPYPHGLAAWTENDNAVLLYDKYDIWQIDPAGVKAPVNLTDGEGRKSELTFRYIRTDPESRFIKADEELLLSAFDNKSKMDGFYTFNPRAKKNVSKLAKACLEGYYFSRPVKAKDANLYVYKKGNFNTFPDLYVTENVWKTEKKLTDALPEMQEYNWGTAELVSWKTDDGITAEGILYKPENFDPAKKYPMLVYFYEKHSNDLYRYITVAPSRSVINIPFFVSRGYLVFTPDIYYKDGHPGQSAYKSIIPGVRSLYKNTWVDTANVAIQGQSWGGYQVAYLVTQTDMFKAAGAGAPVSNMTSAYGGIRWGTGMSRQFQYEHTQSRIGKTLWDGLDFYIENSPLFFADKVNTPLLIMHNDNDGAVPWYQGIEYFTALRRLGKTVWMLQYNNEEHNLLERKNTKDLSIRLQQFFDHYLKSDKMPEWMKYGVPATQKGVSWGYDLVD